MTPEMSYDPHQEIEHLKTELRNANRRVDLHHVEVLEAQNKIAKLEMRLRLANNEAETLRQALIVAEEKGFEQALEMIEIKLVDGSEGNHIRAESAARAREIRLEMKIPRKMR